MLWAMFRGEESRERAFSGLCQTQLVVEADLLLAELNPRLRTHPPTSAYAYLIDESTPQRSVCLILCPIAKDTISATAPVALIEVVIALEALLRRHSR